MRQIDPVVQELNQFLDHEEDVLVTSLAEYTALKETIEQMLSDSPPKLSSRVSRALHEIIWGLSDDALTDLVDAGMMQECTGCAVEWLAEQSLEDQIYLFHRAFMCQEPEALAVVDQLVDWIYFHHRADWE